MCSFSGSQGLSKKYSFHKRGTNLWEGRFFTRSLAERPCGSIHRTSSRCRGIQPLRSKMIGSYFGQKNGHEKLIDTCPLVCRQSLDKLFEPHRALPCVIMQNESKPMKPLCYAQICNGALNDTDQLIRQNLSNRYKLTDRSGWQYCTFCCF